MSIPNTVGGGGPIPGGLVLGPRTTYSTATSLSFPLCLPLVDEGLWLELVDGVVGHQVGVEVVVAHRPVGEMRDAAGDDPRPGPVHPPELVAGLERRLEVVELGRHPPHLRELCLFPGGHGVRRVIVGGH